MRPFGGTIRVNNSRLDGGVAVTLTPSETAMDSRDKRDFVGNIEKVDMTVIWRLVNMGAQNLEALYMCHLETWSLTTRYLLTSEEVV